MTGTRPIRVMLCDDSSTVRAAFAQVLESDPEVQVVARAANGRQAISMLEAMAPGCEPSVILLDLEMPVMDGMTVLPFLLAARSRPAVIVASALTQRGAAATMSALRAGASDYIPKPTAADGGMNAAGFRAELLAKVRGWHKMKLGAAAAPPARPAVQAVRGLSTRIPKVIGIGASTGGPQALAQLVRHLPRTLPVPVLIVQHMPAGFTTMLADHLNRLGRLPCAEASDGDPLLPGRMYLAPGNRHLSMEATAAQSVARLSDGPPENFCRPAVDPMLRSLVRAREGAVLAVILTGMGQDGLLGCRAVGDAGGVVLAQDEASSVVWGMPGAVVRAGLARAVLPPEALSEQIRDVFGIAREQAA